MAHVSIVLPSRNTIGTISHAVDCFLNQSHADKSMVIVDATSTDGTHDLLAEFTKHPEITWISEPERGLSHAINLGIASLPEGSIFGYLGADDFLEPGALKAVSDHFEAHPDHVGLFFDSYSVRDGEEPSYRACPADNFSKENLLKYRSVAGMQNTFLRTDIAKKYPFDESVKLAMDYELFLRLADAGLGERIVHCPQASTTNTADGNLSRTFKRASKREALALALHYAPPGRAKILAWLKYLKYRWV
ncbi:MAG: glycosyltransferase [Pseudomonadota bacterium]